MKFGYDRAKIKLILIVPVIITTAGSVFFFPLNIAGKYTCFYHQVFDHSNPVAEENINQPIRGEKKNIIDTGNYLPNHKTRKQNNSLSLHHGSIMLENYLDQYAFAWWLSIGLLTFSTLMWLRLKKQYRNKEV